MCTFKLHILQCCGSGIREPGSGAFLTLDLDPGSGIGFFPDLGSRFRIPTPYFLELSDKFLGKKFYNSLKTGPSFFHFSILWNLWLQKKVWQQIFFHPSLLLLFLDPGSEIRDPEWVKIRIRDKHPGSATLIFCIWSWFLWWILCKIFEDFIRMFAEHYKNFRKCLLSKLPCAANSWTLFAAK